MHPPFTFHLKVLVSPEESYTDRQTTFSHFQSSHVIQQPELKLFATWKAWNRQYENTETASCFHKRPHFKEHLLQKKKKVTKSLHSSDAPFFFVSTLDKINFQIYLLNYILYSYANERDIWKAPSYMTFSEVDSHTWGFDICQSKLLASPPLDQLPQKTGNLLSHSLILLIPL